MSATAAQMKLGDDDRRAIDLLLDRPTGARNGNGASGDGDGRGMASAAPLEVWQRRLESVERLLKVLEQLPAADPPSDLKGRTLRRLEQAGAGLLGRPAEGTDVNSLRPHA